MKKLRNLFLSLLIVVLGGIVVCGIATTKKVKADSTTTLTTQLFVPSTYFEYYKLNNPIDVCQDDKYIYIAETNAIVVYDRQNSTYTRIMLTDYISYLSGITKIDCYKGNVFFINASKIYYLTPANDLGERQLITTDIVVANYFAIYEDTLFANTSSSITENKISQGETTLSFETKKIYSSQQLQNISTISLAYSKATNSLYSFTLNGCSKWLSYEQETTAFTDNTTYYTRALNGKIYFTNENKLFVYDETTSIKKAIFDLSEAATSAGEIKGFSIWNDKVLIAHSTLNEIYEYDLNMGYTGVSIATTKDAPNRLTENVVDILHLNDYIYALQKESIIRFSTTKKEYKTFKFPQEFNIKTFGAKHFSINDNFLLLSNGNDLYAFTITEDSNNLICENVTINFPTNWDYNSLTGLYAFDGNFYLLRNKTIDSVQNALVIKLNYSISANCFDIKPNDYVLQINGNGQGLTINVFGELYLMLKINDTTKKVVCYDIINKKLTPTEVSFSSSVSKIFCDFENVYCLENNTIYNLTNNTTYVITKHANFENDYPISVATDLTKEKTYILYKGYILQTQDLPLVSPNSFKIPQDLNTKFYDTIKTYKLSNGAKIFEVDVLDEFFNYKNISSCNDVEYIFVSNLLESNNFCLINHEYKSYIARTSDLIQDANPDPTKSNLAQTFIPTITQGYYVTRAGSYGIPILNYQQSTDTNLGPFKLKIVGAYTKVEIIKGLIINNKSFYMVKFSDNTYGYIEKSFIEEKVNYFLADISSTKVYDIFDNEIGTIYPRKVKVYGKDNGKFVIDYNGVFGYVNVESINQKTTNKENFYLIDIKDTLFTPLGNTESISITAQKVKVYEKLNDRYLIEYNNEYGYISTSAYIEPKNNAIRNGLVTILVSTSFFITGIYLQIRYNRKKEF